ncbi:hypothetical protein [Brevibacillus sp. SIMBA_040]|uniref:hypothetical protein n=1 Tax=unclassified Brevibacillus TaxID=2684853 RepID=UPI00397A3F38
MKNGVAATAFTFPRESLRSGQTTLSVGRRPERSLEIGFSPLRQIPQVVQTVEKRWGRAGLSGLET